jgi:predicted ribosomally synthesized peptide with nif11-like leader
MSPNNVIPFLDRVEKDAALQDKLRGLDLQNEAHLPQLLKIAAETGYPITAEDWKNAGKKRAEALRAKYWGVGEAELTDEELAVVAGGSGNKSDSCSGGGESKAQCTSINTDI